MFVKELEITLENGMKISGELDLPERQGQWKTIILFHGSGPSDRHATVESMGGIVSRNFDLLSEGFVKARYAVFRYDKRENYDIEIIIRDAREVTRFVSGLSEVEGILFYGWSEGVRVCTTLVSDFPNAQALILQSGIAEGWSSYFSYILRELTVEKLKELDNNNDSILEISDFLNCIPDSTSISFSLYLLILGTDKEGNMKFNEELDPEGKGRFSIIDNWIPLADEIVADPTTLIRFAENAPGETWAGILDDIKKIQLPILVLHGLNDGWISPVEAVQIAKAARNNADIILFKGLGHSLSKVSSPLKDEGGTIEDRIELTFSTGRLCLVNTHGPVIWLPFLHMPRDEYGTLSINVEEEVNIPSGVTIGNVMLPSVKETFEQIWPDAVKKALEILFKQNRTEKMSMAQYQIYVSKLWSEICQKVGYMNIVDYDNFGDIKNIFYDLEKRHLIKKENDGIE